MTKFIGATLVAAVLMVGAVNFLMMPITGEGGVKAGFIMNKATGSAEKLIDGGRVKFIMIPSADFPTNYPTNVPKFIMHSTGSVAYPDIQYPTNTPSPVSRTVATKLKIW